MATYTNQSGLQKRICRLLIQNYFSDILCITPLRTIKMALDGCGQIYKYILIIFNIIVAVEGFVMFGLGLWLRTRSEISGMFPTDTNALVIGVTMLCVSGTLFLLVAAFGGYGAWRENRTALGVFAVLMGILAVVQIVIGGISYIKMNGLGEQVGDLYIFLYKRVATTGDRDISDVLTKLHHALQCCGLVGALDLLVQKTCPKVGHLETLTYPYPVDQEGVATLRLDMAMSLLNDTDDLSQLCRACGEESSGADTDDWVRIINQQQTNALLEDWDPPCIEQAETLPPTTTVNCQRDWLRFNNSCYYISTRSKSWPDSQAWCKEKGGHLAIILTAEEQTFLWNQLPRGHWNAYWFGITDKTKETDWVWVDGTTLIGGYVFALLL
ncbi:hypothetical protein DPEC_G00280910 [Dallia pectoralis]|uniref:Uncharacterized protein n=1 Tax=Dallia pectoralis TaxID=75939 RepID=A0ACC2FMR5_DALPE|nr:hypothetical protein DPEC_G00280910 [Dallia pectoralis]